MRALPVWFVVGGFIAALVAAIVVGDEVWAAPVVVLVLGGALLLVDRKVASDGRRPADGVTDDLAHKTPGR